MKKIIAIIMIVSCTAVFVHAQDIKGATGNVAVELNFTPLSSSPISIDYLKVRYFASDDIVYRMGLNINMHSEKYEPINAVDDKIKDLEKESYTQFGLYPGIEKHFGNFERFSPYIGAEVGFTTKSSKYSYEDNEAKTTYESKNGWVPNDESAPYISNRAFTSIGLNLLTGADFYFTKKFYLGAEIGFGFMSTSWKEVTVSMGSTTITVDNKYSSRDLGFNYNSAIRLGFCF